MPKAPTADSPTAKSQAPAAPSRHVHVPSTDDLKLAEEDALLQLRIGRTAHFLAIVVSAALFVDGILVLFIQPSLGALEPSAFRNDYFLLFPLGSAVYLSFFALAEKWEAFQLWPWEPHFWVTILSVLFSSAITIVFGLNIAHVGGLGSLHLLPWYFPLTFVAISLPLVGLTMTWSGWSRQQWASLLTAVLPIGFAFLPYLSGAGTAASANDLAIALFIGAILYQTSGSFLHLISSGTRTHERELITSGHTRMFQIADDNRQPQPGDIGPGAVVAARRIDGDHRPAG